MFALDPTGLGSSIAINQKTLHPAIPRVVRAVKCGVTRFDSKSIR